METGIGTPEYTDRYILFEGGWVGHFFITFYWDPLKLTPMSRQAVSNLSAALWHQSSLGTKVYPQRKKIACSTVLIYPRMRVHCICVYSGEDAEWQSNTRLSNIEREPGHLVPPTAPNSWRNFSSKYSPCQPIQLSINTIHSCPGFILVLKGLCHWKANN
jgi:hypothetical protein